MEVISIHIKPSDFILNCILIIIDGESLERHTKQFGYSFKNDI